MSRLIDADALAKKLTDWSTGTVEPIDWSDIAEAPTIDAVEVVRGEWIPCTKSGLPLTEMMRREGQKWYGYRCSNCSHIYKGNALTESPFCQNCGARMKGADDD